MSKLSSTLREKRKASGLKVSEVLKKLADAGISISDKTLYNWENGVRTPDANEFFQLCLIYGVKTFSEFKEDTKKSPAPEGAEDEEVKVQEVVKGLTRLLMQAGWIAPGADLTGAQLRTIASYVIALNFYFKENSDL